jgi:hypothetical protein
MDENLLPGPLTRDEALAIFRGSLDPEEYRVLTSEPDGLAAITAAVDVLVDLSARLDRSITARHLVRRRSDVSPIAGDAAAAAASLLFSRSTCGYPVTLPRGTTVETEDGHRYALDADLPFAAGALGPIAASVTAVVAGYSSTVIAGSIDRFSAVSNGANGDESTVAIVGGSTYLQRNLGDRFLPSFVGLYVVFSAGSNAGAVARIAAVLSDEEALIEVVSSTALVAEVGTAGWTISEWADLGFSVSQPTDTTQGSDATVDDLASEEGRSRQPGETAEALRQRLIRKTDTVAITAILSAIKRIVGDTAVSIIETGTVEGDADVDLGLVASPGFVADYCGADVPMADYEAADPTGPMPPPVGSVGMKPLQRCFFVKWDGSGLDDPGGYALDTLSFYEPDPATWSGDATVTPGFADPLGGTEARQVADADASNYRHRYVAVSIPADTRTYRIRTYIKQDPGATAGCGYNVTLYGGTTQGYSPRINPASGVAANGATAVLVAGWWVFDVVVTNNGTNTFLGLDFYPASSTLLLADTPTATGSVVMFGVQITSETADDAPTGEPYAAAADETPADGLPFGDEAIRAAIWAAVEPLRGHGVVWTFWPRYLPVAVP